MKRSLVAPRIRLADQMQAFSFLEHVVVSLSKQPSFDRDAFISDLRVELSGANRKVSFEQLAQYVSLQLGSSDSKIGAQDLAVAVGQNSPQAGSEAAYAHSAA